MEKEIKSVTLKKSPEGTRIQKNVTWWVIDSVKTKEIKKFFRNGYYDDYFDFRVLSKLPDFFKNKPFSNHFINNVIPFLRNMQNFLPFDIEDMFLWFTKYGRFEEIDEIKYFDFIEEPISEIFADNETPEEIIIYRDVFQQLKYKDILRDELKCFWEDRKDYLEYYNLL